MSVSGETLAPVSRRYLLRAHQMQALSLAEHIPLVCCAAADPVYRRLARRWYELLDLADTNVRRRVFNRDRGQRE
jgi:hypothetical protein